MEESLLLSATSPLEFLSCTLENVVREELFNKLARAILEHKCVAIVGEEASGKSVAAYEAKRLVEPTLRSLFARFQRTDTEFSFWRGFAKQFLEMEPSSARLLEDERPNMETVKLRRLCEILQKHCPMVVLDSLEELDPSMLGFISRFVSRCLDHGVKVVLVMLPSLENGLNGIPIDEKIQTMHSRGFWESQRKSNTTSFDQLGPSLQRNALALKLLAGVLPLDEVSLMALRESRDVHGDLLRIILGRLDSDQIRLCGRLSNFRGPIPCMLFQEDDVRPLMEFGLVDTICEGHFRFFVVSKTVKRFFNQLLTEDEKQQLLRSNLASWVSTSAMMERLFRGAMNEGWMFVPEPYQYQHYQHIFGEWKDSLDNYFGKVNEETGLKNEQILMEILACSLIGKCPRESMAAFFLLDRYLFRIGKPKELFSVITGLEKDSDAVLPAQLSIRKARILKQQGNLQLAERLLESLGETRHPIVKAVSLQVRGEIAYNLFQFENAANLLRNSNEIFANPCGHPRGSGGTCELMQEGPCQHPRDTKGQSYGLGLLGEGYAKQGKWREAAECFQQAHDLMSSVPLFAARHLRRLGASLWKLGHSDAAEKIHQSIRLLKDCEKYPESRLWYLDYTQALFLLACIAQENEFQDADHFLREAVAFFDMQCNTAWVTQLSAKESYEKMEKKIHESVITTQKGRPASSTAMKSGDAVRMCPRSIIIDSRVQEAMKLQFNLESSSWMETKTLVLIEPTSFASGGHKICFKAYDLTSEEQGALCAAKIFKDQVPRSIYEKEVQNSLIAASYASMFNRRFTGAVIHFLPAWLIKAGDQLYCFEPFIFEEDFGKYSHNRMVFQEMPPVIHAFEHFTYHASEGEELVRDCQGWRNVNYLFTDPQVLSKKGSTTMGDLGAKGFVSFFSQHQCNNLCRSLGLQDGREVLKQVQRENGTTNVKLDPIQPL